jgi:hypothetical protein
MSLLVLVYLGNDCSSAPIDEQRCYDSGSLVRCMCAIQNNDPYKRFLKSGHSGNGDTPSPDSVNQRTMSSEMEQYNSDVWPYTSSTVIVL